jgi:hypothetical protein
VCGLDSSGLGYEPVMDPCKDSNDNLDPTKHEECLDHVSIYTNKNNF